MSKRHWYACGSPSCEFYHGVGYVMFSRAEQLRCPFCENVTSFAPTTERAWWVLRAAVFAGAGAVGGLLFIGGSPVGPLGGALIGGVLGFVGAARPHEWEPVAEVDVDAELRRRGCL